MPVQQPVLFIAVSFNRPEEIGKARLVLVDNVGGIIDIFTNQIECIAPKKRLLVPRRLKGRCIHHGAGDQIRLGLG